MTSAWVSSLRQTSSFLEHDLSAVSCEALYATCGEIRTAAQNSTVEQLLLSHHNLWTAADTLHRDQLQAQYWAAQGDHLHGPSAPSLWPQTTQLASAALPTQSSVLRASGANISATHEDISFVTQGNGIRHTADLSQSKG